MTRMALRFFARTGWLAPVALGLGHWLSDKHPSIGLSVVVYALLWGFLGLLKLAS